MALLPVSSGVGMRRLPPLPHHLVCVEKTFLTLSYLPSSLAPPPPRLPSRDPDSLIRWRAPDLSRFPHSHASWMMAPLYSLWAA